MKIVIVGGVAGGMSAATRLRRRQHVAPHNEVARRRPMAGAIDRDVAPRGVAAIEQRRLPALFREQVRGGYREGTARIDGLRWRVQLDAVVGDNCNRIHRFILCLEYEPSACAKIVRRPGTRSRRRIQLTGARPGGGLWPDRPAIY